MANLGTLTMDVIAKIGGFEAGLGSAERQAKKRAKAIEKVFSDAGTAAGTAFGTAIAGALAGAVIFDRLIKQVGDFQDIAEKTGSSAEGFASFSIALGTTNTEAATLSGAMVKLAKGLTGVDDESKAAGAALAALGLDVKDFKALSPEDQIVAVSKALAGFADGAQKTAVAVALFGKSGAELLPFLKELEQQGGRQVVLTAEQIKQADEYADKQARSAATLKQYAQVIAVQALPVVTAFTEALVDTAKGLLGVDKAGTDLKNNTAVVDFAERVALFLAATVDRANDLADGFLYVGKTIGAAAAIVGAAARGDFGQIPSIIKEARAEGEKLFKGDFAGKVAAQFKRARTDMANFDDEARRRAGRGAIKVLDFEGAQKKPGAAKTEKQTEAEKYLESLQKQLQKTQDLTTVETVLAEIQSGRLKITGKVTQDQLINLAKQIDAAKEFEQRVKDLRAAAIGEGDAVNKANEAYQARLTTLIDATPSAILEKQRSDVALLTEQFQLFIDTAGKAGISEAAYLEAVSARLNLTKEGIGEADQFMKQFAENVQSSIGSNLADIMDGNFKNIGDGFSKLLNRMVSESIAAQLSKHLLGDLVKDGSGDGIFGGIAKQFGNMITGVTATASAAGGSSGNNPSAFVGGGSSGGGLGGIFGGLSDFFSGFFADGGTIPAGHFGVVGEAGAELVSGPATVTPASKMGGASITIYQSFAPGTDKKTTDQAAAAAGQKIQFAMARNT